MKRLFPSVDELIAEHEKRYQKALKEKGWNGIYAAIKEAGIIAVLMEVKARNEGKELIYQV